MKICEFFIFLHKIDDYFVRKMVDTRIHHYFQIHVVGNVGEKAF